MLKKIVITAFGLLVLLGILGGTKFLQIKALIAAGAAQRMPAETVTTAQARQESWENALSAVGTLTAVQGVNVAAESPGKIVEIAFESGSAVKAGDLLLKQDTSVEDAQLRAAEASAELAKINLTRSRELLEKSTISKAELDAAEAQFKQTVAQADNIRAAIAKKTVRAPFTGRLGIRLVNLGQTLKEGDAIVSLQALDPIYVDFSLPQVQLDQVKMGLSVRVTGEAFEAKAVEGRITAINPNLDEATRSIRVQATLENRKEILRPGMFVKVAIVLPEANTVLAIPATAILYAPYGDSVFIVEEHKDEKTGEISHALRQQFVRLGVRRGDFVAILSGLKPGETIVTTGVFKLRNGASVVVDNTLAPEATLTPKPSDT